MAPTLLRKTGPILSSHGRDYRSGSLRSSANKESNSRGEINKTLSAASFENEFIYFLKNCETPSDARLMAMFWSSTSVPSLTLVGKSSE